MTKPEYAVPDDHEVVYTKWITRNGKRIPPPNGKKVWRLVIRKKTAA